MLLQELANISEEEFNALAETGVIGPYTNDFLCVGDVIEDKKPIALVDEEFAIFTTTYNYKFNAGLKISTVPDRGYRNILMTGGLMYAVYKNYMIFDELCKICKIKEDIVQDIKMGEVLGYKKEDIIKFLQHNYGYFKVKTFIVGRKLD